MKHSLDSDHNLDYAWPLSKRNQTGKFTSGLRMSDSDLAGALKGRQTRVSLACIICRTKHIRCDARQPTCSRCLEDGRVCEYAKSRRGGLDRAALAARRTRIVAKSSPTVTSEHAVSPCQTATAITKNNDGMPSQAHPESLSGTARSYDGQGTWSQSLSPPQFTNVASDPFIDVYYESFHRFHPCVLPRKDLERVYNGPENQAVMRPLILAIRFLGSLYAQSEYSSQLKEEVRKELDQVPQPPPDPFMVQFYLLVSVALFWCGEEAKGRQTMDSAIQTALDLDMCHQRFATENGKGDPVLEESWRRTWWQIYIVDGFFAATTGELTFKTCHVDASADLPCEEEDYEAGVRFFGYIPDPIPVHCF